MAFVDTFSFMNMLRIPPHHKHVTPMNQLWTNLKTRSMPEDKSAAAAQMNDTQSLSWPWAQGATQVSHITMQRPEQPCNTVKLCSRRQIALCDVPSGEYWAMVLPAKPHPTWMPCSPLLHFALHTHTHTHTDSVSFVLAPNGQPHIACSACQLS